eukprot:1159386-Prymnesium_polylepis.1
MKSATLIGGSTPGREPTYYGPLTYARFLYCRTRATRTAHDDYLLETSHRHVPRARGTAEPRSAR